jgi:hypothetical protein
MDLGWSDHGGGAKRLSPSEPILEEALGVRAREAIDDLAGRQRGVEVPVSALRKWMYT